MAGKEKKQLKLRFAGYPDALLDRACYRHPYAGRLSLDQCLITLQEHLRHHAKQVARIQERSRAVSTGMRQMFSPFTEAARGS